MQVDETTNQSVPDADLAFAYITCEGSMGPIETTDRITPTADQIGMPAGAGPRGVQFSTR